MRGKLFTIICVLILLPILAYGQTITVKGLVTDEAGNPLAGANVLIEGTQYGAASWFNGVFEFTLPASMASGQDVVLSAKYIGFKTGRATIRLLPGEITQDFELEMDPIGLDEVIVVGYGTARKEELTGSIRVIDSQKLEQVQGSTFQQAIQGNPGIQVSNVDGTPGGRVQIRIRGIGSITSSNEPLYVIDGVPVISYIDGATDFDNGGRSANVLATLNPADIENIVVLKDAASTAIYGSRGANGVVLITTKGGVAGTKVRTAKPQFDVKVQRGYSDFAFNGVLKGLTAEEYTNLFYEGYLIDGALTEAEVDEQYELWFPYAETTDYRWRDAIQRTGVTNQIDVSARGGSDNFNYYISGGYLNQEGTIIANFFDRYSSRVNLSAQINDRIHVANNLSIAYTKQRGITDGSAWEAPMYNSLFLSPLIPAKDENGEWNYYHTSFFMAGANPVGSAEVDERYLEQTRMIDNLSLSYQIIEGLKAVSTWSFDIIRYDEFIYENGWWGDGRAYGGRTDNAKTDVMNWQGVQTLNFNRTFADDHNVEVLAGAEIQKVSRRMVNAYGGGYAHPSLHTLNSAANPLSVGGLKTAYAFLSLFTRANYNYQNKYYISGSYRRDGSSRFGPEARWGNFWSAGLGYTITEESFMENVTFIDFLKIRGSYGTTGNAGINNFDWAGLYGFTPSYDGDPGATPTQVENAVLTWESQENLNIGADFAFLNNRISGSVDWYTRTSSDLLLDRPVSYTTGFRETIQNVGDMKNTGIEASITGVVYQKRDMEISLNANITTLNNEITYLPEPYIDGTKRREEGRDFYEYYLYHWYGVDSDNGDPLWYTDETLTTTTSSSGDAEKFYTGTSALPDYYGSFGLFAKKGPFTLTAQFNYSFGNYIYDYPGRFLHADGRYTPRGTSKYAYDNRWTQPGDDAKFPAWNWGGNSNSNLGNSTRYMFKGDYIRMKVLRLGYQLPKSLIGRIGVASIEAYINLANFWTWVAEEDLYIDPEQNVNGIYYTTTPISKTSSFGFNIGL